MKSLLSSLGMAPLRINACIIARNVPLIPGKNMRTPSCCFLELDILVIGEFLPGHVLEDPLCYLLVLSDALDVCQDLLFAAI